MSKTKSVLFLFGLIGILIYISTTGFQCASPEVTGAKVYMQRQDWVNAEKQLLKEVENNPKNDEAWFLLGYVRGEQKNYKGMIEAFNKSLEVSNRFEKDINNYKLKYWVDNFNAGVAYFTRFSNNRDSVVYIDKAIESFKTCTEIIPDSAAAYKNLAYSYLAKGDIDPAVDPLKKAIELSNGQDVDAMKMLGKIYYDYASRHTFKFEDPSNKRDIRVGMSKSEVQSSFGTPDSVVKPKVQEPVKGRKPVKPAPQQPQPEKWVYSKYGLTIEFENEAVKAIYFKGEKYESGGVTVALDSTEFYAAREWYDKAIEVFNKVRNLTPSDEETLAFLSNAYINAGRSDEALEAFRASVEAQPGNKYFHYNYGVLLLRAEQFEDAIREFKAAVDLDPNYKEAVYNLGAAYVNWGVKLKQQAEDLALRQNLEEQAKYEAMSKDKFRQALPYLERLTEIDPNDVFIWELIGKIYANLGEVEKAEQAFKKADELRSKQ
ncbi:Tetratricopeptide repeat-containing protein [Candidatus Kryptonium thompsonii]|uniref:Tetratricopeptide repeat-containing protein n=3 Tax=Candidatus Kryptonium thompsonii TaxID=1633631 RepID=A0A0N7MYD0_9BACT|nr:tetratricopeptide repeat protein [Candidatus Kryptonium thompsoni]CUS78632.1 Tetratricopeptide repeat-containing protein [Candidatus Kryptonium thompsoni]CUS81211.1 Tetratricopeptide repeat-containing protein [Candidatus Kryptonium thompsoni]CUS81934.1 Tetratricopeptide repeat-containing protein [Candidatus Kryptonium thompsoni]CUS87885.1 Tetratricopeptide repeat-containing protein [Candidatus Kryptonium thompsoni]CUS88990.1 Tetratricopeptide repeat-containing protein [Candidatus Kryptonium